MNVLLYSHVVFDDFARTPRALGKSVMHVDPGHGVLLDHHPMVLSRFNRNGRSWARSTIARIAAEADARDAIVFAPEGTNFTARRRERALASLCEHGRGEEAREAVRRRHLLPPHLEGVRILLQHARPDTDVVFFAHVGLESLSDWAAAVGYAPPDDGRIHVTWWHVPAEQIPAADTEIDAWLQSWWDRIDAWIERKCPLAVDPEAQVSHS
jgi:hypothetical protein